MFICLLIFSIGFFNCRALGRPIVQEDRDFLYEELGNLGRFTGAKSLHVFFTLAVLMKFVLFCLYSLNFTV